MEPKDFIYNDNKRGIVKYTGPQVDDGQDHTYNPNYVNELTSAGNYQEAINYIDSYVYSSPEYYSKMQRIKEQCESWINYKNNEYSLAGEQGKAAIDFKNYYNNDYNNLDEHLDNKYAEKYNSAFNQLFGNNDKIEFEFSKEKRVFIFDRFAKDNTDNNINAYKKRLAQSLGYEDGINDAFLEQNGIKVIYGNEKGEGRIIVDKSSPFIKNVIESNVFDLFSPKVRQIYKDGSKSNDIVPTAKSFIGGFFPYQPNPLQRMKEVLDDVNSIKTLSNENDDFVNESITYSLTFQGSEKWDELIPKGGQEGSGASNMRKLMERKLLNSLQLMQPDKQDMRVEIGDDKYLNLDDNGVPQRATPEQQTAILNLINNGVDLNDIAYGITITNDGQVGITFALHGQQKSNTNKEQRARLKFTIFDWNTEDIQAILDANPRFKAIRKVNEISRYKSEYKSIDGNYYSHVGGYGGNAVFRINNTKETISAQQLFDIAERDYRANEVTNSILSRYNTREGAFIGNTEEINAEIDAAAIEITANIVNSLPVDRYGQELSVKDLQAYLNIDDASRDIADRRLVNDVSSPSLQYLIATKNLLLNRLRKYYGQFNR